LGGYFEFEFEFVVHTYMLEQARLTPLEQFSTNFDVCIPLLFCMIIVTH